MNDDLIPKDYQSRLTDYINSKFDRGHMVPAADIRLVEKSSDSDVQKLMDETFYLTNISPQKPSFNRYFF